MIKLRIIAIFFISALGFCQSLSQKPLRTLRVGSQLYFSLDFLKQADGYYFQSGRLTFPSHPDHNEKEVYCSARVEGTWNYLDKYVLFELKSIEGSYFDPKVDDSHWDKFITSMFLISDNAMLNINCLKEGQRSLSETTFGDFSNVFKNFFRFGNLQIDDNGEFGETILDPDNLVVTHKLMDKISLEFKKNITLKKYDEMQQNSYVYSLYFDLQGKTDLLDYKKMACFLWFSTKDKKGVFIPKGKRLRFKSHSVGYERTIDDSGLRFNHSSSGYFEDGDKVEETDFMVSLYCHSSREQSALRYSELSRIGGDWIDWILNF